MNVPHTQCLTQCDRSGNLKPTRRLSGKTEQGLFREEKKYHSTSSANFRTIRHQCNVVAEHAGQSLLHAPDARLHMEEKPKYHTNSRAHISWGYLFADSFGSASLAPGPGVSYCHVAESLQWCVRNHAFPNSRLLAHCTTSPMHNTHLPSMTPQRSRLNPKMSSKVLFLSACVRLHKENALKVHMDR